MLTKQQRSEMASAIIEVMRKAYDEAGEEGDFNDGYRYLANDASDTELQQEYDKWVNKVVA